MYGFDDYKPRAKASMEMHKANLIQTYAKSLMLVAFGGAALIFALKFV